MDELGELGVWNKESFLEFKRQRAKLLEQNNPSNADKIAPSEKQPEVTNSGSPAQS